MHARAERDPFLRRFGPGGERQKEQQRDDDNSLHGAKPIAKRRQLESAPHEYHAGVYGGRIFHGQGPASSPSSRPDHAPVLTLALLESRSVADHDDVKSIVAGPIELHADVLRASRRHAFVQVCLVGLAVSRDSGLVDMHEFLDAGGQTEDTAAHLTCCRPNRPQTLKVMA
jgi:hypothetical protein